MRVLLIVAILVILVEPLWARGGKEKVTRQDRVRQAHQEERQSEFVKGKSKQMFISYLRILSLFTYIFTIQDDCKTQ